MTGWSDGRCRGNWGSGIQKNIRKTSLIYRPHRHILGVNRHAAETRFHLEGDQVSQNHFSEKDRLNRRDAIKLIGAGAAAAVCGDLVQDIDLHSQSDPRR
jgi:hypothetical protein